jgi:hypothetical protein
MRSLHYENVTRTTFTRVNVLYLGLLHGNIKINIYIDLLNYFKLF